VKGQSLILFLLLVEYFWDIFSSFHPDRIQGILGGAGALAPFLYMIIMAFIPRSVLWAARWSVFSSLDFSGGR
jgi:hypothetical protein